LLILLRRRRKQQRGQQRCYLQTHKCSIIILGFSLARGVLWRGNGVAAFSLIYIFMTGCNRGPVMLEELSFDAKNARRI
jgi:hypothetical protein